MSARSPMTRPLPLPPRITPTTPVRPIPVTTSSQPKLLSLLPYTTPFRLAMRRRRAGDDDFVVLERSHGVGGTWHDNRYPGAACDVPSHLSCFSFAPKPDWTYKFSRQPEIEGYFQTCV